MISTKSVMAIDKSDIQAVSKALVKEDLPQLVEYLSSKDDNIRYQAFLLLQSRSMFFDDVYQFWDIFREKLKSDNSYQRSIGLMLVAENAKWDEQNRMEKTIDEYLALLNDEKPITIRQCVQGLSKVVPFKPGLNKKIAEKLISFDLMAVRETMRKSILLDILNVLLTMRKELKMDEVERFILNALSGKVLDKKAKKHIEALLV